MSAAVDAKPNAPVQTSPAWTAPKAGIGDMVHWFDRGQRSSPMTALVTGLGVRGCLTLSIFSPGGSMMLTHKAVRHIDDPDARERDLEARGAWDIMHELPPALTALVEKLVDKLTK